MMIIRTKHRSHFTQIPNAIFNDGRLSVGAKGLLGYLLSKHANWTVRHDQLMYHLGIGRRALKKYLTEIEKAGYADRDLRQGRDEQNRFMTLGYVIRDIPNEDRAVVPSAPRTGPRRRMKLGNNNKEIKTEYTNPSPSPLPPVVVGSKECEESFSRFGEAARNQGLCPVFLGSEPYELWRAYRGADGMPPADHATIKGKPRKIVWMLSLYPPNHHGSGDESDPF